MTRWKSRKTLKDDISCILPGQMSVFDMDYSTVKLPKVVPETKAQKPVNSVPAGISLLQQEVMDKFIHEKEVSRVIRMKEIMGIEIDESGGFISCWINKDGREEFRCKGKIPVLPWYRIIYCSEKFANIPFTKIQEQSFNEFVKGKTIHRTIHRNGDLNILIEYLEKVVQISPNGWVLEFNNLSRVDCSKDEVMEETLLTESENNPCETKINVQVGDRVRALYGKEIIEGRITRKYGMDNEILNIEFRQNNESAVTAIGRRHVLKVLETV